uniref:phosphopyruvate hydratase n=1 Tax=Mandrillus leucophaeus TaxID=9568 RepID=A0A2K5Z606_MANLE
SILKIHAREIFDSCGNPTIEVDLLTSKSLFRAAVPSGASTGICAVLELQDNNKTHHMGKGVSKAVEYINKTIAPALVRKKLNVTEQEKIDQLMIEMDGTENKSQFGVPLYHRIADLPGNPKVVLPVLVFNVINGSSHAGNKLANKLATSRCGKDATSVGDGGAFAANILENKEGLELLKTAIGKAGYTDEVIIGMDAAASEFFRSGKYDLEFRSPDDPIRYISPDHLADLSKSCIKNYPVVSVKGPFDQDDWGAWQKFTASAGIQVVRDGLTVTSPKRTAEAVNEKACSCLLLKVNQICSMTESLRACKLAQASGWGVMVSHPSGETENTFIADVVRLAKYNQLLRTEEELGSKAKFAGRNFRNPPAN